MLVGFFTGLAMKLFEDYLPESVIVIGFLLSALRIAFGLNRFSKQLKGK
jgi:hypothetical protein